MVKYACLLHLMVAMCNNWDSALMLQSVRYTTSLIAQNVINVDIARYQVEFIIKQGVYKCASLRNGFQRCIINRSKS